MGVVDSDSSAAFDFLSLIDHNVLQDSVGDIPVMIVLQKDSVTFHAWDSSIDTLALTFTFDGETNTLIDKETNSVWGMDGLCIEGDLEGEKLKPIQAYEEYWHSWKSFHPETKRVEGD